MVKAIEAEMTVKAGDVARRRTLCRGDVGGSGVGVTVEVRLQGLMVKGRR